MVTVATGHPQNLLSPRTSWGEYTLKIWLKLPSLFGRNNSQYIHFQLEPLK